MIDNYDLKINALQRILYPDIKLPVCEIEGIGGA